MEAGRLDGYGAETWVTSLNLETQASLRGPVALQVLKSILINIKTEPAYFMSSIENTLAESRRAD